MTITILVMKTKMMLDIEISNSFVVIYIMINTTFAKTQLIAMLNPFFLIPHTDCYILLFFAAKEFSYCYISVLSLLCKI